MTAKPRIVVDTNLLVGSAYAPDSASGRIVDACGRGEIVPLVSPNLMREYLFIYPRAVRRAARDQAFADFLRHTQVVCPLDTPRRVAADPDDDTLLAVALWGAADAIVTNDRHLLRLDPYGPVRIVRPRHFVRRWMDAEA